MDYFCVMVAELRSVAVVAADAMGMDIASP